MRTKAQSTGPSRKQRRSLYETEADLAAMERAKTKRDRKAAKRAALAKAQGEQQ